MECHYFDQKFTTLSDERKTANLLAKNTVI